MESLAHPKILKFKVVRSQIYIMWNVAYIFFIYVDRSDLTQVSTGNLRGSSYSLTLS